MVNVIQRDGYQEYELEQNERWNHSLSSGETFSNVLFNCNASNCEFRFSFSTGGWEVKHIGMVGQMDRGGGNGHPDYDHGYEDIFSGTIPQGETALIENVSISQPAVRDCEKRFMLNNSSHAGHIDVRRCYIDGFMGQGIYAAGAARLRSPGNTDGEGGTHEVRNCLFTNNNVAQIRIAADGSVIRDTTIYNTNDVPAMYETNGGANDVVNSRGFYTGYGDDQQHVEIRNCHIELTDANTCNPDWRGSYNICANSAAFSNEDHGTYGQCSNLDFYDCEIVGSVSGNCHLISGNSHPGNPDLSDPAGVNTDPVAAARGDPGAGAASVSADFTWSPANPSPGEQVTFDAGSSTADGTTISSYEWDFGEGSTGTGETPTHTYDWDRYYEVTLTITADNGDTDTAEQKIKCGQPTQEGDHAEPRYLETVNLGDEGLSSGDTIDSYLDTHFAAETRVIIPTGTYVWNGGGMSNGPYNDAQLTSDGGQVTFDFTDGMAVTPQFTTDGADLYVGDITFDGTAGIDGFSNVNIESGPDDVIELERIELPGGADAINIAESNKTGSQRAFRVFGSAEGDTYFIDCIAENWPDGGLLAAYTNGRVRVWGGYFRNNDVSNIGITGTGSRVDKAVVHITGMPPITNGSYPMRGIHLWGEGSNQQISDCDIVVEGDIADLDAPIYADGGDGAFQDIRIRNDATGATAAHAEASAASHSGDNYDVTGNGTLSVPDRFTDVCLGSGCDTPTTTPRRERTDDGDGGDGGQGSPGTDGASYGVTGTDYPVDGDDYPFGN